MQVEGGLGRVGLWEGVQPDEGSGNGVHAGWDHPELISEDVVLYGDELLDAVSILQFSSWGLDVQWH